MLDPTRLCARCGAPFTANRPNRRYCSPTCREIVGLQRSVAVLQAKLEAKLQQETEPSPRWHLFKPTAAQSDKMKLGKERLCTEINLLGREGLTAAELLAMLADTTADLIASRAEPSAVPPYFHAVGEHFAALIKFLDPDDGKEPSA